MDTFHILQAPGTARNYVLLRAGRLRLLLPQPQVGAAVYLDSEHMAACRSFDEDLRAREGRSEGRFVGATLAGQPGVTWCWDEVRVLIDAHLQPMPLPPVLVGEASPLTGFVTLDDTLAFTCNAAALQRLADAHLGACHAA